MRLLSNVKMFVVSGRVGLTWALALFVTTVTSEILTPPYFNLAERRKITASATCGVDTEGPELYCKLVGANAENEINQVVNLIQGQFCDVCDPNRPDKMHPPEFAIDGKETWWQSPPLSRGMRYNEVNLTIDLGQEFHVAYVFIRMGNSPRPGLWILEKSADYGESYTPWQYFSDSPADCEKFFGRESLQPISRDDSVVCSTEYSKIVPLEGGEIPISLLNNRPSANHYFNSSVLQEWTRATNVRLRLLRTKNFLGHLMSVARQDPTVTRRYFYSIKDISIGGRCMCNGHADTCYRNGTDPRLVCKCQHNTCGAKCESCCPGFQQKAWRQSKSYQPFVCEPCNCFLHSDECTYDPEIDKNGLSLDIHGKYEGGGVCQNCQHNTEGINCNKCKPTFYRPYNKHWNETDVCQPCDCDNFYSTGNCAEGSGKCECKMEYQPPNCDSCSEGYYGYPNCKPCDCYLNGTENRQCQATDGKCTCKQNFGGDDCRECADEYYSFPECKSCDCNDLGMESSVCNKSNGACVCKHNYGGRRCETCQNGFYGYPSCFYCNCDIKGTKEGICNKENGTCLCKEGYTGSHCDQCIAGYYGYPDCKPCNCSTIGSQSTSCDPTGKCLCLLNFSGRVCDQCSPGFYKYPECLSCQCDSHGSIGITCDNEGRCECHHNFDGNRCDKCKEDYYNFPSCEACNCHPAGVVAGFAGCGSVPVGELCQCKERVEGRICDKCRPFYWNLNPLNPDGCEECKCHGPGVLGGLTTCDSDDGQCMCKRSVVARGCTECADGTYNLTKSNLFGCQDCGCDIGGSSSRVCDKLSGQCPCQFRVTGRTCNEPLKAHYFPTLYQYQYEVEDGHNPSGSPARYQYDNSVFPEYSWKGYAVFSQVQKEVVQEIQIDRPSLYRMVLRYVNRNLDKVVGIVKVIPENPSDNEQTVSVEFKSSTEPAFVTLSKSTPFVMNPGKWIVSIQTDNDLFLDYFVLLPEEFYHAQILNQIVETPCTVHQSGLCREYAYLNISGFAMAKGAGGLTPSGSNVNNFYKEQEHLNQLKISRIPILNRLQPKITYSVTTNKPGRYVIIINYITPVEDTGSHRVNVTIASKNSQENALIELYSCPYTTVCRQAVSDGGLTVHNTIGDNIINVTLEGEDANIGIESIVAIPYEEWSLDFIQPKPVCIRKDGKCIDSSYPNPPESKKIQFEQEGSGSHPKLVNNATIYITLNPKDHMIDLKGKVPSPGFYVFIVQYYQPDFPEFDLDAIIQNGEFYEAKLPVKYCPSPSGCRSVVLQNSKIKQFSLTENFIITLSLPNNKHMYLDYLSVIPADLYTDRILEEDQLDRTGEFITTCGNNHFNIDTSIQGFCRESVFSITAGYNNGALPCQCNYEGSLSFYCDKFGGQCPCKANIIGRNCEACKTGYFGFPDCKPCNCPAAAVCDTTTGECICPPRVTGELCDQCQPYTYGYDPIIGCEECKCNPLGVQNSLQCNLFNGSCSCKENIVGRRCDLCTPGYFYFPYCESCECNEKGTTEEICDQATAECFCKKYVTGPTCEICREGTYNLQERNPDGCTECFCFGKTTRCTKSNYVLYSLFDMDNWNLVSINETNEESIVVPLNLTLQEVEESRIGIDFTDDKKNSNLTLYFSAPDIYLGKKLTSYGGYLKYTIFYAIGESGKAVPGPDVILGGAGTYLYHYSLEQPAALVRYFGGVELVESEFVLPDGSPAKREHIMTVLEDLSGIYIRGTYWSSVLSTTLANVILDDAIEPNYLDLKDYSVASTVELCHCPPNYQGLSCEECAPGYYRISSGPHGGYCVPCDCNGHADECDVNTGICINCKHNTMGDHCEQCEVGYHGNARQGTPMDCLICACPLPITSNNFATSCDVSPDGEKISCICKEGYMGGLCQSCASGFYGRPDEEGDYCKPCQCSGNINPYERDSCDTVTGECLRCLNNTSGKACALCAPGYYGDAIQLKNCQACICDEYGTDHCNSHTGECVCKQNVEGEKCDRCALEHFGFQGGEGCFPCECGEASISKECDDVTGQCRCKNGVTGRTCNKCASGFWNYTSDGCITCGCRSQYSLGFGCNAKTGQCECLPGVVGEKCDHCPYRWVFIPDVGCHQCDTCTHHLLDSTDELSLLIDPVINEFDSKDSGYFTNRRLAHINDTIQQLTPKVEALDPDEVNLKPIIQELERLEQDSKNMNRKGNYSFDNSKSIILEANDIQEEVLKILDDIIETSEDAEDAIHDIDQLSINYETGEGPKVDSALLKAQNMLDAIKENNLTGREEESNNQLEKVKDLINNIREYKEPVDFIRKEIKETKDEIDDFNDKLDDLSNHTHYALNKIHEVKDFKNSTDKLEKKLINIENQKKEAENNLNESIDLLSNATRYLVLAQEAFSKFNDLPNDLKEEIQNLNITLEENLVDLQVLDLLAPKIEDHAQNLTTRAQELDYLLRETRDMSDNAVRAGNAYTNIIDAIKDAQNAAESGKEFVDNTAVELNGIEDQASDFESNSASILDDAYSTYQKVEDLEPKLEEAIRKSRPVRSLHEQNIIQLENVEKLMKDPYSQSFNELLKEAKEQAEEAEVFTKNTESGLEDTFNQVTNEINQAKGLPKKIDDAKRDLIQVEKQLNTIKEKMPAIVEAIEKLPEQQSAKRLIAAGLSEKIKKLNEQIAIARDVAGRIKVGGKFYPNTTLELRNPPNIADLSTSTYISGHFRTPKQNGMVFYLGNPVGTNLRKTKTDDYMALEILNGYPVLTLDIGNGVEQVRSTKYVADNKWYQFIVDRTGLNAKLLIVEEKEDGGVNISEATQSLDGPLSIFNLDRNLSKLCIGSCPMDTLLQDPLQTSGFQGEIEDLVIGDTPVSLWNFNQAENIYGAYERDKLVNLKPSTGFRFNGNGYAILNARAHSIRTRSVIELKFKTFAHQGLLFLYGKGKPSFIALELRNGKILYKYNLGGETKIWHTKQTYNDGVWHKIEATRDNAKGRLVVDDQEIPDNFKIIRGATIEPSDTFFIGGYPSQHNITDVTEMDFDGCIDNVTILGTPVDLSANIKAYDVTPGCPAKIARLISFPSGRQSHIKRQNISIQNDFRLMLKFKTKANDGLIFYATDRGQNSGISLALSDGYLKLISQKLEIISPDKNFNDSEWHVVSVTHNNEKLLLSYDDVATLGSDSAPPMLHILYGDLFIGSLPRNYIAKKHTVASSVPFIGCIGDATLNDDVMNFANYSDLHGGILGKCILDPKIGSDTDVHTVPILPPIQEIDHYVTTESDLTQEIHHINEVPIRGDGGKDTGGEISQEVDTESVPLEIDFDITESPPEPEPETDAPPEAEHTERAPERLPVPVPTTRPEAESDTDYPFGVTTTPRPKESCALPLIPTMNEDNIEGHRFGAEVDSRLEYPTGRGKFRKAYDFSLDFKSNHPNGIMLYVGGAADSHFVALYLQRGHVVYSFNAGGETVILKSTTKYNEDSWHRVIFSRDGANAKLVIDDEVVSEISPAAANRTDMRPPYYIGGIDSLKQNIVASNLNMSEPFVGCINNFRMNNKSMENPEIYNVLPCSDNAETGVFFTKDRGFVRLKDRFKVGTEIDIKLHIKPRNISGLLMSVHGKKDFLILEMVNGSIRFSVDNGKGAITAVYQPPTPYHFCDGEWHNIQAVKSKSVVSLGVDHVFANPAVGDHRSVSTDTGGALFLGGHRIIGKVRGLWTRTHYVGCIKNVEINNIPIKIEPSMKEGHVTVGFCPKT